MIGAILLYHRIADESTDPYNLCLSPSVFETHMRFIREHCCVRPLSQFVPELTSGRLPQRAVAITFDDGYVDNLTTASPILEALGLPATFFVVTDGLDVPQPYWWDVLARSTHVDDRSRHHQLVRAGTEARATAVAKLGPPPAADLLPRPMSRDEVRLLASRSGHEVGAHTRHHLFLPDQDSETCREELLGSKAELEAVLDRDISAVAYPYGAVNDDVRRLACEAGFRSGVTTGDRYVRSSEDVMMLPRMSLGAETDLESWLHQLAEQTE
jgi:peptidoglycan/xylan/chitin deacetylase (PgdA/CDA1 family)